MLPYILEIGWMKIREEIWRGNESAAISSNWCKGPFVVHITGSSLSQLNKTQQENKIEHHLEINLGVLRIKKTEKMIDVLVQWLVWFSTLHVLQSNEFSASFTGVRKILCGEPTHVNDDQNEILLDIDAKGFSWERVNSNCVSQITALKYWWIIHFISKGSTW